MRGSVFDLLQSCCNCVYSDDGSSPSDRSLGEWVLCRRRAPRVLQAAEDGFDGGPAVFPRVTKDDWCGEWRSKTHISKHKHWRFLEAELEIERRQDDPEERRP